MYPRSRPRKLGLMATKTLRTSALLAATVLATIPFAATAATAAPPAPAASSNQPAPGAQTLNDRLFPGLGNGGYDASDYDVSLTYRPNTQKMPAAVTMRALATQSLSEFSLDSVGQQIQSVTVDGRPAQYRLEAAREKLIVTPARPILKHLPFTVHVSYTADRSLNPAPPGLDLPPGIDYPFATWNDTPDGFGIMNQPNRAHLVFPSNDHPSDKARYTIRITAPSDRTAVAGGHLSTKYRHGGETTWVYRTAHPIKTDVVQIAVGKFRELKQTGPHHLPIHSYLALAPYQGKTYTDAMEANAWRRRAARLAGRSARQAIPVRAVRRTRADEHL